MAELEELDAQYAEVEGRGAVTFIRSYAVPAAQAWAAVSTEAGLEGWFPSRVEIAHDAGRVTFSGDPNQPPGAGRRERITAWEPPRRWAFAWGGDVLEFLVEGSEVDTELTLRNWLADNSAAARNAAGWHVCLERLAKQLERIETTAPHSGPGAPDQPGGPLDWDELYAGYVAAGLPSGAPIPGRGD